MYIIVFFCNIERAVSLTLVAVAVDLAVIALPKVIRTCLGKGQLKYFWVSNFHKGYCFFRKSRYIF